MTIFEQEASKTEAGRKYESDNENALEWITGSKVATVTLTQRRLISRVEKLAQNHPEAVQIVRRNDSSIVAHLPAAYIKLQPPREMSEAQAEVLNSINRRAALERANSEG